MDIRILRNFLTVCREKNITRAAETLHIAQPSLSKQLMDLENEIGKQLLIRGKRKISLTEEGILLRKRAEEVVELYDKMEREMKADSQEICGTIGIGGAPTYDLLKVASQMREKYPDVQFDFYMNEETEVIERLDHGTLDFAVILEPVDTLKYESMSLSESYHWGVVMPVDCEFASNTCVTPEQLCKMPIIMHKRAGLQRTISNWAGTEIEKLNIAATYNVMNGNPIKYVNSRLGYLLTTEELLPESLENSVCFKPLSPALEIHFSLVWKRHAVFSRTAEYFLNEAKDRFCKNEEQNNKERYQNIAFNF